MVKRESIPDDVWQRVTDTAAKALDHMPTEGPQLRSHRIASVAFALLAERDSLPDEIDIYQMLKREGLRKRAEIAKFIAAAIRAR